MFLLRIGLARKKKYVIVFCYYLYISRCSVIVTSPKDRSGGDVGRGTRAW